VARVVHSGCADELQRVRCRHYWCLSCHVAAVYRNRLVELIVLGIGLDSGVLNQRLYVMMVIMAIITTVMTTPLVMRFSPPEYRERMRSARSNNNSTIGRVPTKERTEGDTTIQVVGSKESESAVVSPLERGLAAIETFGPKSVEESSSSTN